MTPGNGEGAPREESAQEEIVATTTSPTTVPRLSDKMPEALRRPESSPAFDAWLAENPPLTGIDAAIAHASPWDAADFRAAVTDWAHSGRSFTIEDVLLDTGTRPDSPNTVGALTQALAREGLIHRVGYTKAKRASRAGGVVAVWIGSDR